MDRGEALFGTDGVRGEVGKDPITVESFLALGKAIGQCVGMSLTNPRIRPKIIIGKDTRLSNYMLEQALSAGICSAGIDSMLLGPVPTPGVAFLTQSMRADAGLVISASHNPHYFNGLKIFDRRGEKFTGEQENRITELYHQFRRQSLPITPVKVGKCKRLDDVLGRYIVHLKSFFPHHLSVDGLRVRLDCAHGAAYKVAPIIFEELGCIVHAHGTSPNGENINDQTGSTSIAILQEKMRQEPFCDVGFAFDGDGDRGLVVTARGDVLDGDHMIAAMVYYYQNFLQHEHQTVVLTEMSNVGVMEYIRRLGWKVHVVPVGDRHLRQGILETKAIFGAEPSGHVIFSDQFCTGDGILTAINFLRLLADTEKNVQEFYDLYHPYPSASINVPVEHKPPLAHLPETQRIVAKIRQAIGDQGKVLVRYSGTEPLLRIMVQGSEAKEMEAYAEEIAQVVRQEVNVRNAGG